MAGLPRAAWLGERGLRTLGRDTGPDVPGNASGTVVASDEGWRPVPDEQISQDVGRVRPSRRTNGQAVPTERAQEVHCQEGDLIIGAALDESVARSGIAAFRSEAEARSVL
ncbi:MAG: hypothetical protein AAGA32_02290 [Pseudomonadota bacterium]